MASKLKAPPVLREGCYLTNGRELFQFLGYGPVKDDSMYLEDCKSLEFKEVSIPEFVRWKLKVVHAKCDS